jgi:hypothetical protein
LPALAVLIGFTALGPSLGGVARPLFILSCGAAGWYAWRRSPGAHLQAALLLFTFAPFVRRVVDLSAGYDNSSTMLIGPLLAILAPAPRVLRVLETPETCRRLGPLFVVAGCVIYAAMLSMFQGEWMNAASNAVKWLAPIIYAMAIADSVDADEFLDAAASIFMLILPAMGIYGIIQYVDPPSWDQYWMQFAPIMSAGQPVPFGVRTFSTMNGPASFATFTAAGLILVFFRRSGWLSLVVSGPAAIALLLSLYRTAWIALFAAILFCTLFGATRRRSMSIWIGLAAAIFVAATLTPFGDVIGDRLSTFGEGSQDGSARERLEQFINLWTLDDSGLFGIGFSSVDVGVAGSMAVDGMLISCWLSMGIVVGLLCLFGLFWALWSALTAALRDTRPSMVLVGAFGLFELVQVPLANVTAGELGFLFWTFTTLSLVPPSHAKGVAA